MSQLIRYKGRCVLRHWQLMSSMFWVDRMYLFVNPVFFTCGPGVEFGIFKPEGDLLVGAFNSIRTVTDVSGIGI